MKKVIALVCLVALLSVTLCACSMTCEHCGGSTLLSYNMVGSGKDAIQICNSCVEKMSYGRLDFNFTCDHCGEEKVGKENDVVIAGEEKTVCNTCLEELGLASD